MDVLCSVVMQQKMVSCKEEAMALLKGETAESEKLHGQGISKHQKSMKNVDCYSRHRSRSKSVERKLSATSLGKPCRYNEGSTPKVSSKNTTESKKKNIPEILIGAKNSRNQVPNRDQSGLQRDF